MTQENTAANDWNCVTPNGEPNRRGRRRTFVRHDYPVWRRTVLRLLADFIDRNVLNELRLNPPKYFNSRVLAQLEEIISKHTGERCPDLQVLLADRMRTHYEFIRAFHGCRTNSIESYQSKGLIPCNPLNLDKLALEIFSKIDAVRAAIADLAMNNLEFSYREHNNGKVWFCLDKEELTEFAGHYLLYGSEYLQGIAARVDERDVLQKRGRATLVECNVPIDDMSEDDLRQLAFEMLIKIAETFCTHKSENNFVEFGFFIECCLAPENIVQFHFPTEIPNPLNCHVRES